MIKLSVIIPCLNVADTIAVQLEALANQQWCQPWEVIIADNGCSDDSMAIAQQYQERLPLRIVDASDQPGRSHACNIGATLAMGEALAFCDADDEVAPGWVAAMGEALCQYDFVACRRDYEKLNEPWTLKWRSHCDGLNQYKYPPYLPHAAGATLGVKRSVHQAIGGFDETLLRLQDTDYCWRIQLAGIELHFVPEAVIHYRFRHTLAGLYQQARLWGEYNVFLYKKYRPLGMPELSWIAGVKSWLRLLKHFPLFILSKEHRVSWVWGFAWQLGRLQGCIKYKVMAL